MASMNTTGYTRSRGRFCHSVISSSTLSVIRELVSFFRRRSVDILKVCRDLAGGQSFVAEREHDLVDAGQPPLPFAHDLRLETRVGVPRDVDLDRADLGEHRLRSGAAKGSCRC